MADPRALRAFNYWALKYRRSWRRTLLPSLIGPALYMVVMGKVLGELVTDNGGTDRLDGVSYLSFVAPAVVAAAAMLTASSEATNHVFHATRTTRAYAAMLATPLRIADLVTGHLLWMAVRMTMVSVTLAVLVVALGASHSWGVLLLVPIGILTGMSIACGLMGWSARQERATNMLGWQRFGATPMLLFSGIFYPVSELPLLVRRLVQLTPLWHGAELAREATIGSISTLAALGHALYLLVFVAGGTLFAMRSLEQRLVEP
jgi:lipooligosaccharide transport system permease protein